MYNETSDFGYLWSDAIYNDLITLDNQKCYSTFAVDFVHDYQNVILVTQINSSQYNKTLLSTFLHSTMPTERDNYEWFCARNNSGWCEPDISQADDWNIDWSAPYKDAPLQQAQVQYCLALHGHPFCTIEFIPELLVTVIVCNILKIVALIVLIFSKFDPLITIGDAIASFMKVNEPITKERGAISAAELRHGSISQRMSWNATQRMISGRQWKSKAHRYFSGAATGRWLLALIL